MLFKKRRDKLPDLTLPEFQFRALLSLAGWDQDQTHWDRDQAHALAAALRAALDDIPDGEEIPSLPNSPPAELFAGPHKAYLAQFIDILERCAGLEIIDNQPGPRGWDGWLIMEVHYGKQ